MPLADLLRLTWRWIPILLISAVGLGATAGYVAGTQPPVYVSNVTLLVGPTSAPQATLRASGQIALTYAEIANNRATLNGLDLSETADVIEVGAVANDITRLVNIEVRSSSASSASIVANALTRELSAFGSEPVEVNPDDIPIGSPAPPAIVRPEGLVTVIDDASIPDAPANVNPTLVGLLVGIAAALAVLAFALWKGFSKPTVHSLSEIERLGFPFRAEVHSDGGESGMETNASFFDTVALPPFSDFTSPTDETRTIVVFSVDNTHAAPPVALHLAATIGRAHPHVNLINEYPPATTHHPLPDESSLVRRSTARSETRADIAMANGYRSDALEDWITAQKGQLLIVASPPLSRSGTAHAWLPVADLAVFAATRNITGRQDLLDALSAYRRQATLPPVAILDTYHHSRFKRLVWRRDRTRRLLVSLRRSDTEPENTDDDDKIVDLSDNDLSDNELSDNELSDNELSNNELTENDLTENGESTDSESVTSTIDPWTSPDLEVADTHDFGNRSPFDMARRTLQGFTIIDRKPKTKDPANGGGSPEKTDDLPSTADARE